VVATAVGGDDIKALRQQVVQLKMNNKPAWINNQQDWPDVYGLGPEQIFGVFGTNWYYRLDLPGVKEFVAAYQKTYPASRSRCPATPTTTATWPPASCCVRWSVPARPTT
jgi:branched-chain amino acid transport system substrate-binding protein